MKYYYTISFTADINENVLKEHLASLNICDINIFKELNINDFLDSLPESYEIDNLDLLKDVLNNMSISPKLIEIISESYLQAKNKSLKSMLRIIYLSCLAFGKTRATSVQLLEKLLLFYPYV